MSETENLKNRLLGPACDRIGSALAHADKPVLKVLESCRAFINGGKGNTEKLVEITSSKLAGVSDEELVHPSKSIVVLLLQLNAYTDDEMLRDMFANLLAATMKKKTAKLSHPSFVDILRQLSPEEALFLKSMPILKDNMPICEIRFQEESVFHLVRQMTLHPNNIIRNFTAGVTLVPYYFPQVTQFDPENDVPFMIENFIRLNLLSVSLTKRMTDPQAYSIFYKDTFTRHMEEKELAVSQGKEKADLEIAHIIGTSSPTAYGKRFYDICVSS